MKFRDSIRVAVIKTNPYLPFSFLNKIPYYLAIKVFVLICKKFPQIKSVYLRHGLTEKNWVPGLSDIDLTVIIDSKLEPNEEYYFLESFWRNFDLLKKFIPILGEVDILNDECIASWTKFTIRGYEARFWKLIYGTETTKNDYIVNRERLTIDSLNHALTIYTEQFLLKFYNNEIPEFIKSKKLNRLTEKISNYASKYHTKSYEYKFVQKESHNKLDSLSILIKILESNTKRLNLPCIERILEEDDNFWLGNIISKETLTQRQLYVLTKLASEYEEIVSIILSDLKNFIVLRDGLDTDRIKKCLVSIHKVDSDNIYRFVIISSSIFKYMMIYHVPHMYIHLKRKRTVFIKRNLLLDIKKPEKHLFIQSMLGQLINVLSFPQSYRLFSMINENWIKETNLETYLTRFLSLKLMLEKGFITVENCELLKEGQKQYPHYYKKIEKLKKKTDKSRNRPYTIEWFKLLKDMANDIHSSLCHSSITANLFKAERVDLCN